MLVLLAALLFLAGCREKLSDEKADAILKDLAARLVEMEDSSGETRMAEVRAICAEHGAEIKALAAYLKDNPNSEDSLARYMGDAFDKQLAEKKKKYSEQLKEIDKTTKETVDTLKESSETRMKTLGTSTAGELEKLKAHFDKKQAELEKAIAAVKAQQ